jgi:hypothetical protein
MLAPFIPLLKAVAVIMLVSIIPTALMATGLAWLWERPPPFRRKH